MTHIRLNAPNGMIILLPNRTVIIFLLSIKMIITFHRFEEDYVFVCRHNNLSKSTLIFCAKFNDHCQEQTHTSITKLSDLHMRTRKSLAQ